MTFDRVLLANSGAKFMRGCLYSVQACCLDDYGCLDTHVAKGMDIVIKAVAENCMCALRFLRQQWL